MDLVAGAASAVPPIVVTLVMPVNGDPTWLHYLSILGAPFVAAIAAYIAWRIQTRQVEIQDHMARIAKQAAETARNKLKFDLFDKRWAIYIGIQELIAHAEAKADFDRETMRSFAAATSGTKWVFDGKVDAYVALLIEKAYKSVAIANTRLSMPIDSADDYQKSKLEELEWDELRSWWAEQRAVLDEKVAPFMRLRESNLPMSEVDPIVQNKVKLGDENAVTNSKAAHAPA